MSKRHTLKCWPSDFQSTWDGVKKHEVRKNDRDYQVGDSLALLEWDPVYSQYTGRTIGANVTYVSRGPDWGLPEGLCVMSIEVWERKTVPYGTKSEGSKDGAGKEEDPS